MKKSERKELGVNSYMAHRNASKAVASYKKGSMTAGSFEHGNPSIYHELATGYRDKANNTFTKSLDRKFKAPKSTHIK